MRTTAITGASARSVAHPGDTRGGVIRMRDFPLRLRPRYPCDMAEAFLARVRAFVPQAEAMGIPGAVLVAQAVLESGWGRSGLARVGRRPVAPHPRPPPRVRLARGGARRGLRSRRPVPRLRRRGRQRARLPPVLSRQSTLSSRAAEGC